MSAVSAPAHHIQITERDLEFLRGLFESRAMTLAHAAALHFSGSLEAAKKRTQRLKRDGFIRERTRERAYDPSILSLARRGLYLLSRAGRVSDYPAIGWPMMQRRANVSPFTLQHELDVMTVKASLISALRNSPLYRVVEFSTWPRLFEFKTRQQTADGYGRSVVMKPDAFARIESDSPQSLPQRVVSFFVELDRSTETQLNLRGRASGYLDFHRTGGFAKRFGHTPDEFRQFPFRVLWIFRNTERRNNAAESFLRHNPPILTMPWLTTFEELVSDPLGKIWVRPLDYQHVVRSTPFDLILQSPVNFYRRQSAREQFVEARITKRPLFRFEEKSDPFPDRS